MNGVFVLFIYLFIYNIRYEMHRQDPILVNNKIKGCRDIKNNTVQTFNNTKSDTLSGDSGVEAILH